MHIMIIFALSGYTASCMQFPGRLQSQAVYNEVLFIYINGYVTVPFLPRRPLLLQMNRCLLQQCLPLHVQPLRVGAAIAANNRRVVP